MPTRAHQRAERISKHVDLGQLLSEYNYEIIPDDHREQQFRCDLHGIDNKPSARFYPETNSTFCFACGKARDPVSFIMDKEGLEFRQACELLEKRANLAPLPWKEEEEAPLDTTEAEIEDLSHVSRNFGQEWYREDRRLQIAIDEKALSLGDSLKFATALDRIRFGVRKQGWSEGQGKTMLLKLRERLTAAMKAC